MVLTRPLVLVAFLFLVPSSAVAQSPSAPLSGPAGWKWALDAPARLLNGGKFESADSLFEFVHMAPGWHITMGPGAALFDSRERAEGRFAVQGELILFPNASANEYGLFVGGRDLEGQAKQWFAFVVRADGSAAVMHRAGSDTHVLVPWAKHTAVKPKPEGATVTNVVTVRAEPDSVRFLVNGERIAAFARGAIDVDGAFGFRIGQGVNLHITNLDVTRRLAPFPARR
jgi:hypothetical protein